MAKTTEVDLNQLSLDEINLLHDRIIEAKGRKAIEAQNELIARYQELRKEMIATGVVTEDQLPALKRRGWTRSVRPVNAE